MKYIKISYNKNMKKIIVTTLLVSVLTCGCGLKGVSQSKTALQNPDQEEVVNENPIEQTNQGVNSGVNLGVNKEKDLASQKTEELKNDLENLHPIDKAKRDCVAKVYSTHDMNECGYKAMDSWFKEIDKYLGLLKTVTSEEEYSDILKAQEKWKEYQEAEFVAISIIINKQGTIYQTITLGEKEFIVKQRALALKNLYEYWIE